MFRRGRELSCVYSTTTTTKTTTTKSSRFSKDILRPFSSSPSRLACRVLLIYFSPPTVPIRRGKRFLVKTIFREYVCRAQSRAFPSVHETKDGEKRGKTAVFLAKWKYRYEASVCVYSVCVCVGEIHECTLRGTTVAPPGQDGRVDESVYLAFCLASEGRKELLSVL